MRRTSAAPRPPPRQDAPPDAAPPGKGAAHPACAEPAPAGASGPRSGGAPQDAAPPAGARRIIGVDPGLASTGWGVLDCLGGRVFHVAHGCIETRPGAPMALRLLSIMEALAAVLAEHGPTESAVETLYFGKNASSGMPVAQARGVVLAALAGRGLAVAELAPSSIKKGVTGVAAAGKRQVQEMARVILGLAEIPRPDHAADALGVAICASALAPPELLPPALPPPGPLPAEPPPPGLSGPALPPAALSARAAAGAPRSRRPSGGRRFSP